METEVIRMRCKTLALFTAIFGIMFCLIISFMLAVEPGREPNNFPSWWKIPQHEEPKGTPGLQVHQSNEPSADVQAEQPVGNVARNVTVTVGDETMSLGVSDVGPVCPPGTRILLLVISAPGNWARRKVLRRVWMSQKGEMQRENIFAAFLVGQPQEGSNFTEKSQRLLEHETKSLGDIITLADHEDVYYRLTYKVIAGYAWAREFCKSAKFIGKVDDDVFVNIKRLNAFVEGKDDRKAVLGPMNKGLSVIRDPNSKWYIPPTIYGRKKYPPYAAGFFYLVTAEFADAVLAETKGVALFPIDDAYITGILREALHANKFLTYMDAPGVWRFGVGPATIRFWLSLPNSRALITRAPIAVVLEDEAAMDGVHAKMQLADLLGRLLGANVSSNVYSDIL
ncbi:unnamed protein product [Notodromas monacha]|uniref:Hexosyltransferase n=1 Tax=Notodromas monacha TaxID=399045 RepID=A0A7R9BND2_9CRUS|nr:unnamed protein product [Notodromas monacha]CAG0917595.1 unnamed protein product [Notodromas monacha]